MSILAIKAVANRSSANKGGFLGEFISSECLTSEQPSTSMQNGEFKTAISELGDMIRSTLLQVVNTISGFLGKHGKFTRHWETLHFGE